MTGLRRYEIFLPLQYNDGSPVPDELLSETLFSLRKQFGAVSWETQIIRGQWEHESIVYQDNLTRLVVLLTRLPQHVMRGRSQ